jgi:hypothetical protein
MKRFLIVTIVAVLIVLGAVPALANTLQEDACWGQATAVFAQMGVMGEHAAEQETPRIGLRNLARDLDDAGVLEDDSLQALGAFVAEFEGLTIEACQ